MIKEAEMIVQSVLYLVEHLLFHAIVTDSNNPFENKISLLNNFYLNIWMSYNKFYNIVKMFWVCFVWVVSFVFILILLSKGLLFL